MFRLLAAFALIAALTAKSMPLSGSAESLGCFMEIERSAISSIQAFYKSRRTWTALDHGKLSASCHDRKRWPSTGNHTGGRKSMVINPVVAEDTFNSIERGNNVTLRDAD